MNLGLSGKTALILAAGGGLGRSAAVALAGEGAKVAVADKDPAAAAESAKVVQQGGGKAISIEWDLANFETIGGHIQAIEAQLGPIDVLVNITGGPPPTPAAGQDPKVWSASFQSMILSVIAVTDAVLPGMKSRKWGRVITSTSSGVLAPIPNLGISNALRLSLVGWSKTISREIARDGVTANIVVPGRIATSRIEFLDAAKAKRENRTVESVVTESTSSIPVGRYGTPEEFGATVAFLASTQASYITGSVIRIDGGMIQSV